MNIASTADRVAWAVVVAAAVAGATLAFEPPRHVSTTSPDCDVFPDAEFESALGMPGAPQLRVRIAELRDGPHGWEVATTASAPLPSDRHVRFRWVHTDIDVPISWRQRPRTTFRTPGLPPAGPWTSRLSTTVDLYFGRSSDRLARATIARHLSTARTERPTMSTGRVWTVDTIGLPDGVSFQAEAIADHVLVARLEPLDATDVPKTVADWRRLYAAGLERLVARLADDGAAVVHRVAVGSQLEIATAWPVPEARKSLHRLWRPLGPFSSLAPPSSTQFAIAQLLAGDVARLGEVRLAFGTHPENRPHSLRGAVRRNIYLSRLYVSTESDEVREFAERELLEHKILPGIARRLLAAEADGRAELTPELRRDAHKSLKLTRLHTTPHPLPGPVSGAGTAGLALLLILLVLHTRVASPRGPVLAVLSVAFGLAAIALHTSDPGWRALTPIVGSAVAALGAWRLQVQTNGRWAPLALRAFVLAGALYFSHWVFGAVLLARLAAGCVALAFLAVATLAGPLVVDVEPRLSVRPRRPARASWWRLALPFGIGVIIAAGSAAPTVVALADGRLAQPIQALAILLGVAVLVAAVLASRRSLRNGRGVRDLPPLLVVGYIAPFVLLQTATVVHAARAGIGLAVPPFVRAIAVAWALCAVVGGLLRLLDAAHVRSRVERTGEGPVLR